MPTITVNLPGVGGDVVLATATDAVRFPLIDTSRKCDEACGFGWEEICAFDRGNARTQIDFEVRKKFATCEEAIKFRFNPRAGLNLPSGNFELVINLDGAGECKLPAAVFKRVGTVDQKGVSLWCAFSVVGGEMVTS